MTVSQVVRLRKYSDLKVVPMRAVVFVSILTGHLMAQHAIVEMKNFDTDQMYIKSFAVKSPVAVYIDAVGVKYRAEKWNRTWPMFAYGWILNTDTRDVVWAMSPDNVSRAWGTNNVEFKGTLTLKPGNYEAYYSTYGHKIVRISSTPSYFGEFIKNLVKVFVDDIDLLEDAKDWKFSIFVKDEDKNKFGPVETTRNPKIISSLTGARNYDYLERGFTIDRDMRVKVYCNGEGADGRMYDYGWITNDKSGRTVWQMEFDNTTHGGGAMKNRTYSGIINLTAGNYIATYITDDSHSPNDWNMSPPFDPSYWGLTIFVLDEKDASLVHEYKRPTRTEVLSMTRIGDSQYRSQGITVKKTVDLHITAMGEGRDHQMFDYAWLTDVRTGNRIWEMRYHETRYAGGGHKNRLYEGTITLQPGDYMFHYVSDGSHSYSDWNDDPPYKPSLWGVTVSLVNNSDAQYVEAYTEKADATLLAQIVRVGDNEYKSKTFTVDKTTRVRVHCIGEGSDGEMYDYGWIKSLETGQTIWEMTYSRTEPAGGARKNRQIERVITLEPGEYRVYYVTDGSHSFEDWNDDPPYQPDRWGITVRIEK